MRKPGPGPSSPIRGSEPSGARPLPLALAAAVVVAAGCTGAIRDAAGGSSPSGTPPGLAGPITRGRVVAHRLNNVEYDTPVRDLFGVDMKPSSTYGFPADGYVEGFDNNADALTASPLLLEKLQSATDAVVARAMDP